MMILIPDTAPVLASQPPGQPIRLHAIGYGNVRGVRFCFNTVRVACGHAVTGWCRQLKKHTAVEVFAQSSEMRRLLAFMHFLQRGPLMAEVKLVQYRWEAAEDKMFNFSIADNSAYPKKWRGPGPTVCLKKGMDIDEESKSEETSSSEGSVD